MPQTDGSGVDDFDHDPDDKAGWYSDETATFGDRLAGAREAAGLSQRDLAERLGIKASTLRKWEDDQADPRANRLSMLAGMLGVSLTWLLTGEGEGVDAPGQAPDAAGDIAALLDELRTSRTQIEAHLAKLGRLEKRLRKALRHLA